jgi:hypothetical protein
MSMMSVTAKEVGSPRGLSNNNSSITRNSSSSITTNNSLKFCASTSLDRRSDSNPPHAGEAKYSDNFKSITVNDNCHSSNNTNIDFISEINAARSMPIRTQSPQNNPSRESSTTSQTVAKPNYSHCCYGRTDSTNVCLNCEYDFVCEIKLDTKFCSRDVATSSNWTLKPPSSCQRDAKHSEAINAKKKSFLKAAMVLGVPVSMLFSE